MILTAVLAAVMVSASVNSEPVSRGFQPNFTAATAPTALNITRRIELAATASIGVCYEKWGSGWNWDDYKYVCDWSHGSFANIFFLRYDGFYEKECNCDKGVHGYDPFSSRWTYSESGGARCYSRDGQTVDQFVSVFDLVDCSTPW